MIFSTFVVSMLGLLSPLASEAAQNRFSMTMDELNKLWDIEKPVFGRTPENFEDVSSRRRLASDDLAFPDRYYERCVFWINSARAKEGLPAVKRWRDFEPCSDRTAKYDEINQAAEGYHASVRKGLFCDWANYQPIGQNTCPLMQDVWGSNRINQECTMTMWTEKALLEQTTNDAGKQEIRCKNNGQKASSCAGHYTTLRGGEYGYNAFDRVACGFHQNGNLIWINQNFGSGIKTRLVDLLPADKWTAPKDWVPTFEPYGFECGGDAEVMPVNMLVDDCLPLSEELQYNTCAGVARQDYYWWGCAFRPVSKGGCDHGLNVDITQLCDTQPFDTGFAPTPAPVQQPTNEPTPSPTAQPTFPPEPTPEPTPAPSTEPTTPAPTANCNVGNKRTCKKTDGCMWQSNDVGCIPRTVPCSAISKSVCKNAAGCFWDTSLKPKACNEIASS